jgi:hypothetical protein
MLPTDNYPPLVNSTNKYGGLFLSKYYSPMKDMGDSYQHIYITSDEEIKEGDYYISILENEIYKATKETQNIMSVANLIGTTSYKKTHFKIILTTDQDLIKDGVQAIGDEFLEWFVKNPSCEFVEVVKYDGYLHFKYMVITSQEESFVEKMIPLQLKYNLDNMKKATLKEPKQLFTDHPITELGDKEFVEAPIRECELLSFDDNKYCYVKVEGIEKEIKRCYIYPQKGRCGDVDCVSIEEIKELLKEEPEQDEHYLDSYGCTKNEFELSLNFKKEKPKQETLEEFAKRIANDSKHSGIKLDYQDGIYYGIEIGAKWHQERMYSEEEVKNILIKTDRFLRADLDIWFKQFKKK